MFERTYCVNLDRRPDRWDEFSAQVPADWPFAKIERAAAIDGKKARSPKWWTMGNGAWGCYRSHLRLIEQCLNENVESVLLLEDDALFCENFVAKAGEFLSHVPSDWGMLYLGGQHLKTERHKPVRVNEHVYQPFNVNRTHAFALRGETMRQVYEHLSDTRAWRQGHHIDHHLGMFHQRRTAPIYCPAEWLVGQAPGKSNISGKRPPERFWIPSASLAEVDPSEHPFVAVVGLHSSGSSCVGGVLHHLGVHMGNELTGYYGRNPDKSCGFEAVGLVNILKRAIPFPDTERAVPQDKLHGQLRRWINNRRREAASRGTIAGGKYPQLCRCGEALKAVAGEQLRVVHINRPLEESIASLIRRDKNCDPERYRAHQQWLWEGKQELLDSLAAGQQITVEYADLLADPMREIARLTSFLNIEPTDAQKEKAAGYVNPARRHVNLEAAA